MGIKNDWFERQIEEMGEALAAILFGIDNVRKVFQKFEDVKEQRMDQKSGDLFLEVYINKCLEKGELKEAQEYLFSYIEDNRTLKGFTVALSFYSDLLRLSDQELEKHGFTKAQIEDSIEKLKLLYV